MVVDPKCSSGDVGVIQCPQIPTVAATTTTTTTTPATTVPQTTAPKTTTPKVMEEDNTKSSEPASTPQETASSTVKTTPATSGKVPGSFRFQKQPRSSDDGKHEGIGLQKSLE